MSWKIVPQIEKVKKVETEVKCKHLKAFPIESNGDTIFGRFKFLMLRVILQHDVEKKNHVITYNDRGGHNTFIYHWPTKAQGQDSFGSLEGLHKFLSSRGTIADEVVESFGERIGCLQQLRKELAEKKAEAKAKEEKALAKAAKLQAKEERAAIRAAKKAEKERLAA
jgi:hypothetical protein